MKPVFQTVFGFPEQGKFGNCFPAAVASLLEIPLEEVPHFNKLAHDAGDIMGWDALCRDWCKERGYTWIVLNWATGSAVWAPYLQEGQLATLGGPSPRNPEYDHCVVGRWSTALGWQVEHDPHPSDDGLYEGKVKFVDLYVPISPV